MLLFRPSWKLFPVFIFAFATVYGGMPDSTALQDARNTLTRLAEKQSGTKTLRLKFESQATGPDGDWLPKAEGLLWAADSGRFRIEHAQGVVVCDGHTLWQYFPANKQVILKQAENGFSADAAGGVLLRFLQARPISAHRTKEGLRVILDPTNTGENLDSLILILDPGPPTLRRVETQDPNGTRTVYRVKACDFGIRIRPGTFSFTPPAGVEVVDMR